MKEAQFHIKTGRVVVASGSIFHADGKSLDSKAINGACALAAALGYLHTDVLIWRPGKNGTTIGAKRAEIKPRAKEGEPKYKAVAA